jgi:hypothetical protein
MPRYQFRFAWDATRDDRRALCSAPNIELDEGWMNVPVITQDVGATPPEATRYQRARVDAASPAEARAMLVEALGPEIEIEFIGEIAD